MTPLRVKVVGMDETFTYTLTLPRPLAMGLITLVGVTLASCLVYLTLPEAKGEKGTLHHLRAAMGLSRLHPVVMLVGLVLYAALVGILILGLFGLIIDTLMASGRTNDYLFYVLRIGGLTAVLGAVVAFPFTLIRLGLSQESLFNDKINEATKGLYARRQITLGDGPDAKDHWQDDIVQRNAAIDRLEGLAQEKPTEAPRIARLLSVYVRELSAEVQPANLPSDADAETRQTWAHDLPNLRSDMEKAAQTLGRLADVALDPLENGEIDLRGANLQNADLIEAKLEKTRLQGARLEGANLSEARLQGADLSKARLQGANLIKARLDGANLRKARLQETFLSGAQLEGALLLEAQLQGSLLLEAQLEGANLFKAQFQRAYLSGARLQRANLRGARLQRANLFGAQLQRAELSGARLDGANLSKARLQGAYLRGAQIDASTTLTAAIPQGAAIKDIDLTNVPDIANYIDAMFGDATVTLPDGVTPPPHWSPEELDFLAFDKEWRAWQATLPPGWDSDSD